MAWALTDSGQPVVAGSGGLYLPGQQRLDWADIERVGWRRPQLTVWQSATVAGSGQRWAVTLQEQDELAEAVRTHVSASVGWSTHYAITGGGVRVVGRRRPGHDLLIWQLVYDRGTDPDDPVVRAQAEQLLLDARRTIG